MKIGLDIDGTITDKPEFFVLLSQNENFEVHILTGRGEEDNLSTAAELDLLGVKYKQIHYADSWEDKGRICKEHGIEVYFDDMDEFIAHIPESTFTFKVRNRGNWNPGLVKVNKTGWIQ